MHVSAELRAVTRHLHGGRRVDVRPWDEHIPLRLKAQLQKTAPASAVSSCLLPRTRLRSCRSLPPLLPGRICYALIAGFCMTWSLLCCRQHSSAGAGAPAAQQEGLCANSLLPRS